LLAPLLVSKSAVVHVGGLFVPRFASVVAFVIVVDRWQWHNDRSVVVVVECLLAVVVVAEGRVVVVVGPLAVW
jgi:hypothetical protein